MDPAANTFKADYEWQRQMRDRILVPLFYGNGYALGGRYVFVDKGLLAKPLQRMAVDTIVQRPENAIVCLEEKIVRFPVERGYPYDCFCLETKSCTNAGYESAGWMHYAQADYLLYCFANEDETTLDTYQMDFPKLKEWFWPRERHFPRFLMKTTYNRTCGRVVPIEKVERAIGAERRVFSVPFP